MLILYVSVLPIGCPPMLYIIICKESHIILPVWDTKVLLGILSDSHPSQQRASLQLANTEQFMCLQNTTHGVPINHE